MNLKTRRVLFFASLAIFLIASPAVIMYSLGYKFDTETFTMQKTGGIFVNADYGEYTISINDSIKKDVQKAIFIKRGILFTNLIPKVYKVSIEKNNYLSWSKTLPVESGLVTEVKNVFLMPKDPEILEVDKDVSDFTISGSQEKIAYLKKSEIIIMDVKSGEKISMPSKSKKTLNLTGFSSDEKDIFFEDDSNIYKTSFADNTVKSMAEPKNDPYAKIAQSLKDKDTAYALSKKGVIYELNIATKTRKEITKDIKNFYLTGNDIVYITTEPQNFYKINIDSGKTTQITFNPLSNIDQNSKIIKRFDDPVAVIDKNSDLLIFSYGSEKFNKLADNIIDAQVSSDLSKMFYRKDKEIYVYYFTESYPAKKAGDTDLIGIFGKKIKDASWFSFNNHHLFLNFDNDIKIIELDGRDKRNSYTIAENIEKFEYNNKDKFAYIIKNNDLKKIRLMEE
ncbi:hypothetical protein HY249_02055 [Candidatus Azambacteria bacterium]|nr:hypothetical protein [Candidatus Azambacteria bacterium]